MPGNKSGRGFTLLEVTAALVLLGLGLTMLYAGHLAALELESKNAETAAATDLARSLLAEAEAGASIQTQGSSGIYRWHLERFAGEEGLIMLRATVAWGRDDVGDRIEAWSVLPGNGGGH